MYLWPNQTEVSPQMTLYQGSKQFLMLLGGHKFTCTSAGHTTKSLSPPWDYNICTALLAKECA